MNCWWSHSCSSGGRPECGSRPIPRRSSRQGSGHGGNGGSYPAAGWRRYGDSNLPMFPPEERPQSAAPGAERLWCVQGMSVRPVHQAEAGGCGRRGPQRGGNGMNGLDERNLEDLKALAADLRERIAPGPRRPSGRAAGCGTGGSKPTPPSAPGGCSEKPPSRCLALS
jgi:hypothetical protein